MKYVQFIDRATREAIDAASVAAWSVRKRGNLPADTWYILYSTDPSVFNDPTARAVFDELGPPPVDATWFDGRDWDSFRVPHRRYIEKDRRYIHRLLWLKFCCWLDTPTDGDAVIFADYDTICFGSIREAVPPAGYSWAGRLNGKSHSCNGGFLVKTALFTDRDARIMKEPLDNRQAYAAASFLWKYDDEMATAWYAQKAGTAGFYPLEMKFNQTAQNHAHAKKTIEEADVRLLHFIGDVKPWHEPRPPYTHMMKRWWEAREQMREEYGISGDLLH